jgi:hypothetical protein
MTGIGFKSGLTRTIIGLLDQMSLLASLKKKKVIYEYFTSLNFYFVKIEGED